jgi:hypothetical protein
MTWVYPHRHRDLGVYLGSRIQADTARLSPAKSLVMTGCSSPVASETDMRRAAVTAANCWSPSGRARYRHAVTSLLDMTGVVAADLQQGGGQAVTVAFGERLDGEERMRHPWTAGGLRHG